MNKQYKIVGIVGLILLLYGLISAIFYSNVTWYSYFAVGGTLFLGYINYAFGNRSIFKILEDNWKNVIKIYVVYLVFAIIIEVIGRFWLGFWEYPSFNVVDQVIHVFLIGYPFALFFIYESFVLIRRIVKTFCLTLFLTGIANALLHEIPNTFAWEWVYNIPYVVVFIGWFVLITIFLIVHKILRI